MNNASYIYNEAEKLAEKYGTRNPITIMQEIGIDIFYNSFDKLLGMYTCQWNHRIVILNSLMQKELLRMVAAHELGHDRLHYAQAQGEGFQEFSLSYQRGTTEYEANAFAAHLLIPTKAAFETLSDYSIYEAASILNVDSNLLIIKLNEMKKIGYDVPVDEYFDSCFLKDKAPTA